MEHIKLRSVSSFFLFKAHLVGLAKEAGFSRPVFETIREGPPNQLTFRSTVTLNNVKYDSLPGFSNIKEAEYSAAEVALIELAKTDTRFSQPMHETGLCKKLLEIYLEKLNLAPPLFECRREENSPMFKCFVEIGGVKFIGASATSMQEAVIKTIRIAVLSIQSTGLFSEDKTGGNNIYTVLPRKNQESRKTVAALKPKKTLLKKKQPKKMRQYPTVESGVTFYVISQGKDSEVGPTVESGVTDIVISQGKDAEVGPTVESGVPDIVISQGKDSEVGNVETTTKISNI